MRENACVSNLVAALCVTGRVRLLMRASQAWAPDNYNYSYNHVPQNVCLTI